MKKKITFHLQRCLVQEIYFTDIGEMHNTHSAMRNHANKQSLLFDCVLQNNQQGKKKEAHKERKTKLPKNTFKEARGRDKKLRYSCKRLLNNRIFNHIS